MQTQQARKSTTHEETFRHIWTPIGHAGTVFFRKEASGWFGSPAYLSKNDQFNRAVGRSVARRRYFQGGVRIQVAEPTVEAASEVFLKAFGKVFPELA